MTVRSGLKWMQGLLFVGQLAFLVITPPLTMIWLSLWLSKRFGWGEWVILAAIFIGFVSAGCSVYNLFRKMLLRQEKKKDSAVSYNKHI